MRPSARFISIALGVLFCLLTAVAAAQDWEIDWYSIDGGGVVDAAGEDWSLSGTFGQWDASDAAAADGGPWQVSSGFWSKDAPETDWLFADDFEE